MKKYLGPLMISLAAWTICIGGSELGVRFAFRDVTTTSDDSSYLAALWYRNVRQNAQGFREKEFVKDKPLGAYRIAVVGDSIARGHGINDEDRFSKLIEGGLKETNTAVEVLNFGLSGAETEHQLETLSNVVLPLQPDFILLQWYTNDVEGRDKSLRPQPMPLIPYYLVSQRVQRKSLLFWLLEKRWILMQEALGWAETYADYMLARFAEPEGRSWIAAEEALREFIRICNQNRIPLGIVLFSVSSFSGDSQLDFLTDRALRVCESTGTSCLDLRDAFARYKGDTRLWASRLDSHPSAFAHQITAQRLMQMFGDAWIGKLNSGIT